MANLRILAVNVADTATMTADPAMVTTLPLTNLQRQTERGRVARTTSLASQDVKLTWAEDQAANMIAVTRHNWTTAATLRALAYASTDWTGTALHDGTALAAFSTSGLSAMEDYTARDFAGLKSTVQYFTEVTTMQSAIARIADAANPDGYIEQTRLFIGKYFEVEYNPPYEGVELTLMDDSRSQRADDGSHIVHKRWKARRLAINVNWIPDADLPEWLAIARILGRDRECFIDLYPEVAGAKGLYNRMACRLVEQPVFSPNHPNLHRGNFVFEET